MIEPRKETLVAGAARGRNALEERSTEYADILRRIEELESLMTISGSIAHDFNNILQGIMGHAEMMLIGMPPDSAMRSHVQEIQKSARQAGRLTTQLMAFPRRRMKMTRVHLEEFIGHLRPSLESAIPNHIRLILSPTPGPAIPLVQADETQLCLAVMNLISNSAKAIGDAPGTITVSWGTVQTDRSRPVELQSRMEAMEGLYAYVEVMDDGAGVNRQTLAHTLGRSFSTEEPKRGLGLPVVQAIALAHRGALKAQSAPNAGASFSIYLPLAEGAVSQVAEIPQAAPTDVLPRRPMILVVDDDENVRFVARASLERFGFDVLLASSGREGLDAFHKFKGEISAVLLDLTMPDMNGDKVFDEMRRMSDDIPVVLSSGYREEDAMASFGDSELAGFLQKPYSPLRIVETMRSIIGQKQPQALETPPSPLAKAA